MDPTHDHEDDRLMGLPLELRQRVYLYCGFPVVKDWYHACYDEVVTFIRLDFGHEHFDAKCTALYRDPKGTLAQCSASLCFPATALMAVSRSYSSELDPLLNRKGNGNLLAHSDVCFRQTVKEKYQVVWDYNQWFQSHHPPGFICHLMLPGLSAAPTFFPTRNITKFVGVVHWDYDRRATDACTENCSNIAGVARMACLNFPRLSVLKVVIEQMSVNTYHREVWLNRKMISTLLTASICAAGNLRSFSLTLLGAAGHPTEDFDSVVYELRQDMTLNVPAIPQQHKSTIILRLLACTITTMWLDATPISERHSLLRMKKPCPLFQAGLDDFCQDDSQYLTWYEEVVLGPYTNPLIDDRKIRKDRKYKITERNVLRRKVVGRQDDASLIWSDWRSEPEVTRECLVGRRNPGPGFDGNFDLMISEEQCKMVGFSDDEGEDTADGDADDDEDISGESDDEDHSDADGDKEGDEDSIDEEENEDEDQDDA